MKKLFLLVLALGLVFGFTGNLNAQGTPMFTNVTVTGSNSVLSGTGVVDVNGRVALVSASAAIVSQISPLVASGTALTITGTLSLTQVLNLPTLLATGTAALAGTVANASAIVSNSNISASTVAATQAFSIQRANHTGTQLASTISNFASTVAGLPAATSGTAFVLTGTAVNPTIVGSLGGSFSVTGTVSGGFYVSPIFSNPSMGNMSALTITANGSNLKQISNFFGTSIVEFDNEMSGADPIKMNSDGSGSFASGAFQISSAGTVTASKFNGNTLSSGTGTLNLNGFSATVGASGTINTAAFSPSSTFVSAVSGSSNSQTLTNPLGNFPLFDINVKLPPYYAAGLSGTTTTSGTLPTSSTSVPLVSATTFSVNQGIFIAGSGTSGADYIGTVTAISGTVVTVTPATATSVASGALVQHDDTTAFQSALTALSTTGGSIYAPSGFYRINGPLVDTSGANCKLKLPAVPYDDITTPITISIYGAIVPAPSTSLPTTTVISTSGTSGNLIGAYNTGGYAVGSTSLGNSSNVWLTVKNISFRAPEDPSINIINSFTTGLIAENLTFDTGHAPAAGYFGTTIFNKPTHSGTAIINPPLSNNAQCLYRNIFIYGFGTGIGMGEHSDMDNIYISHAINGVTTAAAGHGMRIGRIACEYCTNAITAAGVTTSLVVDSLETESISSYHLNDPSSLINGIINYNAEQFPLNTFLVTGGTNVTVHNLRTNVTTLQKFNSLYINGGNGNQAYLDASGAANTVTFRLSGADAGYLSVESGRIVLQTALGATQHIEFYENSAERMRISGTGAAITVTGSANITGALSVGATTITGASKITSTAGDELKIDNTGQQYSTIEYDNNGTAKAYVSWDNSAAALNLQTQGNTKTTFMNNGVTNMAINSGSCTVFVPIVAPIFSGTVTLNGSTFSALVRGTGQLTAGSLVVSNTNILSTSSIIPGDNGGGVLANMGVIYEDSAVRVSGTMTLKSINVLDTSKVSWLIVNP